MNTYTTADYHTFQAPFIPAPAFCARLGVPIGTWAANVETPTGHQYLTVAPDEVLAAFDINQPTT